MSTPATLARLRALIDAVTHGERVVATLATQWRELDAALAGGGLPLGAVCEVLAHPGAGASALLFAVARQAQQRGQRVAWLDMEGTLYPPALEAAGLDLQRLLWLRPKSARDARYCLLQVLDSGQVGAFIVEGYETDNAADQRRLQLFSERHGCVTVLLRNPAQRVGRRSAAATRLVIEPVIEEGSGRGLRTLRWRLVKARGGIVGATGTVRLDAGGFVQERGSDGNRSTLDVPGAGP